MLCQGCGKTVVVPGDYDGPQRCDECQRRDRCCGLIWEHGAFTQTHLACHDCPERIRPEGAA